MNRTALVWWLASFRRQAEGEAEASCHRIETSLGLALLDLCAALGLDSEQTRLVIGDVAYQAIVGQPMPVVLAQEVDCVQQAEVS